VLRHAQNLLGAQGGAIYPARHAGGEGHFRVVVVTFAEVVDYDVLVRPVGPVAGRAGAGGDRMSRWRWRRRW
jgi:hypothetical protein